MKKRKNNHIFKSTAILCCILGILLCAAPSSVAEQIDDPQDYLFVNTDNTPVDLNAEIYEAVYVDPDATLNLLAGAIVHYLDAYGGSIVNIYGGIADDFGIAVFEGSTVTVYGTEFIVEDGTIDPSGDFFTVNGIGMLTGTYADGTTISILVFSSEYNDVPIYLVDTSTPSGGPVEVEVQIDIKPCDDLNRINLDSKGLVPVAVLGTDDFDAATVDPAMVEFAGAEPVCSKLKDVNHDGYDDMIFNFRTQDLDLDQDSTEATLMGQTTQGVLIEGSDEVQIVSFSRKCLIKKFSGYIHRPVWWKCKRPVIPPVKKGFKRNANNGYHQSNCWKNISNHGKCTGLHGRH